MQELWSREPRAFHTRSEHYSKADSTREKGGEKRPGKCPAMHSRGDLHFGSPGHPSASQVPWNRSHYSRKGGMSCGPLGFSTRHRKCMKIDSWKNWSHWEVHRCCDLQIVMLFLCRIPVLREQWCNSLLRYLARAAFCCHRGKLGALECCWPWPSCGELLI